MLSVSVCLYYSWMNVIVYNCFLMEYQVRVSVVSLVDWVDSILFVFGGFQESVQFKV